jgi:hypothetical protein
MYVHKQIMESHYETVRRNKTKLVLYEMNIQLKQQQKRN